MELQFLLISCKLLCIRTMIFCGDLVMHTINKTLLTTSMSNVHPRGYKHHMIVIFLCVFYYLYDYNVSQNTRKIQWSIFQESSWSSSIQRKFQFCYFFPEMALLLPGKFSHARAVNETTDIRKNLRLKYPKNPAKEGSKEWAVIYLF